MGASFVHYEHYTMKFILSLSYLISITLLLGSCSQPPEPKKSTTQTEKSQFTPDILAYYKALLDSTSFYLNQMDSANSVERNQQLFLQTRKWYKRAEPLIMAYDVENYKTINAPNLLKVEMEDFTEIKRIKPKSYQVLEELLFAEEFEEAATLQNTLIFLKARLPFMAHNHMIASQRDRHHLKMVRDAIVNIATKGITGFDSPMLAQSLDEAIYNYQTIEWTIDLYKEAFNDDLLYKDWKTEINKAYTTLKEGDFDSFDRYSFIKDHTNKQLELVNRTAEDWKIQLAASRALNPIAINLFGTDFFNMGHFAPATSPAVTSELVALGRTLFNDPSLSKTGDMSCATCHQRSRAFTDGLALAMGNKQEPLQRNSPTVTYAALQRSFFYEGRSSALESQILGVLNNTDEFHMDLSTLEQKISEDPEYRKQFAALYDDGKMSNENVRSAISTYIRSLAPFDSKFDRNMQDQESTLSDNEILGFNLFMGKAACATCHFPPSFFGTVPPGFGETELENLGVPANNSFTNPILDTDPGAFEPYKVEERRGFFKTSTVRNIALTAPYMHNGVYNTLEEVLTFYNVGGGLGMGLDVPYQTLPPDSLQLTDAEQQAIIAFMRTLTDAEFEELPQSAGDD